MTSNSRFNKVVGRALWRSKRFAGLSGSDAKLLHLYYLTSEHQTSAGAYRIDDGYAIADLGWTLEQYRTARDELVKAGLVAFDDESSVVYVLRWFKHNPPMNPKHAQACVRMIEELDSSIIADVAQGEFDQINVQPLPSFGGGSTVAQLHTRLRGAR